MRRLFADTLAMIIFATVFGMIIEVVISGMALSQSVHARMVAVPVNLVTARPYGLFRDWMFRITRADAGSQLRQGIVDIVSFVFFQVPLYANILAFAGASFVQIMTACITVTAFSVIMGRPYGLFLEFCRWLCNAK